MGLYHVFSWQNESRGLKNPEGVRRKRQQKESAEKHEIQTGNQGSGLKVNVLHWY